MEMSTWLYGIRRFIQNYARIRSERHTVSDACLLDLLPSYGIVFRAMQPYKPKKLANSANNKHNYIPSSIYGFKRTNECNEYG